MLTKSTVLLLTLCWVLSGHSLSAQVAINDTAADPDASAMLDVTATDKGILIPRLSTVQRDAIESPATGLLIYNTDDAAFDYYDGSEWVLVGGGVVDLDAYFSGSDQLSALSLTADIPTARLTVLDAANLSYNNSTGANDGKWQSFVAQRTGNLVSVRLEFLENAAISFNSFRIYTSTDPDSPYEAFGGSLLYEASNFVATGPTVEITLDPVLPIVAGQRYFIVVDASGSWRLNTNGSDVYTAGRASSASGLDDYGFRTYVREAIPVLSVDQTSGNIAIANGAISVVGTGVNQLRFDANTGALQVDSTMIPEYGIEYAGDHSISFGTGNLASGSHAFAVGSTVVASGQYSMAMGRNSIASGKLSLAMGANSNASAEGSVAIGDNANAGDLLFGGITIPGAAIGSVAIGHDVTANGLGAMAFGQETTATGTLSFAVGNQALTLGEHAFAVGNRAEAHGARSVALGDRVKGYGDASAAFGLRNNAQSWAEFVVGAYTPDYTPVSTTAWNANDRLFVVGNGSSSSNRSTALIVYKSGDATLNGQLTLTDGSGSITLPNTDGSAGQVLATDGNGAIIWIDGSEAGSSPVLSLSGDTLSLSSGGSVDLSGYLHASSDLYGIATLVGSWNGSASADASNEVGGESYNLHDGEARQTFTAQSTGELREVELNFYAAGFPAPGTFALYAGDQATGILSGSPLVSQSFTVTNPGWFEFAFESGTEVEAGSVYTIVVTLDETEEVAYWSQAQSENPYVGGRASTAEGDDFNFRAFVASPEDVALMALNASSGQMSLGNGNVLIDSGTSPDYALTVNGGLRVANGGEAAGYLAMSDANGSLLWVDPASISTAPDGDDDASNELQNLSSSASGTDRTISISNGIGTTIDVADNDNSSSNEFQTLSLSGTDLTLSDGGGAISIVDGDGDDTNELQSLTLSGTDLTLSDGGGTISIVDGDGDASNELQTLSLSGTDLTLSNDGGTVSINDADSSVTNELQNLSSTTSGTNRTINISDGTGTTISVADNDNSATNELQTLSLSGTNLTLSSNGGTVSINDADSSATNELQTLSQSGGTVTLSNGGGSVVVPWSVSGSSISSTNTGNVGLGTTSPDTRLSVVGYVRAAFEAEETNYTEIGHGGLNGFIRKTGEGNLDFRTQTGTWMSLTDEGELGIGTDDPTALLDVNGSVRLRGGSPANGKVLTADASGNATWEYTSLNAGTAGYETEVSVAGNTSGWQNFGGTSAPLAGLANGNKVMVIVSCRVKVGGSTGPDSYTFRIQGTVGATVNSTDTGLIENLGQQRNQWQLLTFHRVVPITTAGTYLFRLQVEMTNADDTIYIDQQEITAYKL